MHPNNQTPQEVLIELGIPVDAQSESLLYAIKWIMNVSLAVQQKHEWHLSVRDRKSLIEIDAVIRNEHNATKAHEEIQPGLPIMIEAARHALRHCFVDVPTLLTHHQPLLELKKFFDGKQCLYSDVLLFIENFYVGVKEVWELAMLASRTSVSLSA